MACGDRGVLLVLAALHELRGSAVTAVELAVLERAVEELPPKTREALRLLREDGLSYEQIGERLQIPPQQASKLVERAMEYLLEQCQ